MLETVRTALRITELRKRLLFTLLMFVIFRIGSHIPVPGVDAERLVSEMLEGAPIFEFMGFLGGGALNNFAVFALGIMPYINASIIMNLLTVVIPKFKEWSEEGPEGRKKLAQFTRYGTVVIAFFQAIGMTFMINQFGVIETPTIGTFLIIVISLTAGTAFLMWMGELITERGIGNGISLIIFAGIIAGFPYGIGQVYTQVQGGELAIGVVALAAVLLLLLILGIIGLDQGQRRIRVQYSKRVVGRKMYGGQSTHIPMKVNQAGVIPVIFASVLLMFPATIAEFVGHPVADSIAVYLSPGNALYLLMYVILIILFAFFYTAIQFDPNSIATNIKKYGGFIPGLRPGKPTAQYLSRVITRLTTVGAFALAFIAVFPMLLERAMDMPMVFHGTGLIIVVGVTLETMKQIEGHLLTRSYRGFMK